MGGAGVQRSAKFIKYLPSLGWVPHVLTSEIASSSRWTPDDRSLLADVPKSVPINRAAPLKVSAAAPRRKRTEARIDALIALGHEIIRNHRPQLIFVTMSPFADAQVAARLSMLHKIPWVADLRDPWALDEFQVYSTRWHRLVERQRMRYALRTATRIIMNTPEASRRFRRVFPDLGTKLAPAITNGYDVSDFGERIDSGPSFEKFTIIHSGYFHAEMGMRQKNKAMQYRILGRIEPGVELLPRSHYHLLAALERILQRDPALSDRLQVICLGSATETDQALVNESGVSRLFRFTGYLPHSECVKYVRNADLLFLPMHKLPLGVRATIVPGKTYEYMASHRPILATVPEGDARDYVSRYGVGRVGRPGDVDFLEESLKDMISGQRMRGPTEDAMTFVRQFERQNLTRQLAEVFDSVAAKSNKV